MHQPDYNLIKVYKSLLKISLIAIICAIFIIPFAYFMLWLIFGNSINHDKDSLNSLLIISIVLGFDVLFYVFLEVWFIFKIFKNKITNKAIIITAFCNFIFTFISFIALVVILFNQISNELGIKIKFSLFKKKSKRISN